MERVTLFYLETSNIKSSMELYFNDKSQLYFDGYDIGKLVEEIKGDYDYEYTYTIESEEVNKFYVIFDLVVGDKPGLLQSLKNRFSVIEAYLSFGDFMKANNIKYESFTWA